MVRCCVWFRVDRPCQPMATRKIPRLEMKNPSQSPACTKPAHGILHYRSSTGTTGRAACWHRTREGICAGIIFSHYSIRGRDEVARSVRTADRRGRDRCPCRSDSGPGRWATCASRPRLSHQRYATRHCTRAHTVSVGRERVAKEFTGSGRRTSGRGTSTSESRVRPRGRRSEFRSSQTRARRICISSSSQCESFYERRRGQESNRTKTHGSHHICFL
jgi:hypothetical protein